eukprot:gb/GECG01000063.1/.p1 GENE.gb/GECG01000063.1/~~gb/GECG01000063.1/.p1  ORF type:complete len:136 (+),score=5.31 gb/GECG01000063.1/:1-408(+)
MWHTFLQYATTTSILPSDVLCGHSPLNHLRKRDRYNGQEHGPRENVVQVERLHKIVPGIVQIQRKLVGVPLSSERWQKTLPNSSYGYWKSRKERMQFFVIVSMLSDMHEVYAIPVCESTDGFDSKWSASGRSPFP